MADRPGLIGIAGPSCSGKTSLARLLAQHLPDPTAVFSFDSYYRDFASLPTAEKARFNFDAPEALDSELLIHHLEELAEGESIERPVYRFDTHSRTAEREKLAEPGIHQKNPERKFEAPWLNSSRLALKVVPVLLANVLPIE